MSAAQPEGTLVIEVKGINTVQGDLQIGLYNRAEGFAGKNTTYAGKVVAVTGNVMTVEITGLPYGTYAATAYHDKNGNGELDKNFFGVPTEVYGFSNNARGTFGPPSFAESSFELKASTQKISFDLK